MISAPINKKLGTRLTLVLGGLSYAFWIGMFLLPIYKYEKMERNEDVSSFIYRDGTIKFLSLFSAFVIGFGSGPMWVSVAYHITACCNSENVGIYTGLFYSLYNTSYLSTNLLAGYLIENANKSTFYWIMTILAVIGSSFFMFVESPEQNDTFSLQTDQVNDDIEIE